MKETSRLACAVVIGALGLTAAETNGLQTFTLPGDVAKYREWTSLLQHPHGVPMELWIRCMAPSPEEWEAARRKFGPHTQLLNQGVRQSDGFCLDCCRIGTSVPRGQHHREGEARWLT